MKIDRITYENPKGEITKKPGKFLLDEVVVKDDIDMIHIERMSDSKMWMVIYPKNKGPRLVVEFWAKNKKDIRGFAKLE